MRCDFLTWILPSDDAVREVPRSDSAVCGLHAAMPSATPDGTGIPSENVIGHRSSRYPLVSIMEPAHLRECDDGATLSPVHPPSLRSVLLERQMGASTVVVAGVVRDDPADMPLIESDHVIQALAAQGPHKPLCLPEMSSVTIQAFRLRPAPAHLRECDDLPVRSRLDSPGFGSVLRKG